MARQRGNKWQADITLEDGNRFRPTFPTEEHAVRWEVAARDAIEMGKPLPPVSIHISGSKTRDLALLGPCFDFVKRTVWSSQARGGVAQIRNGQTAVDHWGRNKPLNEITSADIADWKSDLADEGLSPSYVNKKIAALSKILKTAHDAGAIDKMPSIKWNAVEKTRFRFLDEQEERVLLAYWSAQNDQDNYDLTIALIDTGARCFAEMMTVAWEDFGPQFSTVTFWKTKTKRPRTVPLTKRVREMLARRQKLEARGNKGPFTSQNEHKMRSRWDTMRAVLDFHDVTPHVLRHTCCTRLVLAGVDIKRVMEWMGHSAIVTTMRYMQMKPRGLEDILYVLEGTPQKPKRKREKLPSHLRQ
ncbi:site-specific integrase [Agrobacterium vitis]|uniref:site-specific integrase n=1 Tax=Agrobacterium vitis TaxID=373 RepID=UPI0018D22699|nr:site-specific integrase [Agrobacterium vitis]